MENLFDVTLFADLIHGKSIIGFDIANCKIVLVLSYCWVV